ncbi:MULTISPECIES: membrane or secreted protein [Crateriforma]|uniref:Membrane or secreted protein n=1 Tax=Crateriforma conspicua TaxID=2527996 RepID=A0A5C5Y3W2_9PLAN|nr:MULTISPECIES: membrane or secreted protein [Crateriforma]QDV64939.1 hypothetical protein Mal65_41070 [Crateriforma conspicua]TWT70337.1 hypothetical protein Pan14r_26420 [Crateriforma conspicua]TWU65687.1 hypothetical protein V7x_12360 [Crateriforma conspicua]
MTASQRQVAFIAGVAVCLVSLGCRGRGWLPAAGPIGQQQASAVVHDPYPQADIGPSDAGARPPSYQKPLAEPVRNRLVPDLMPWLGR